MDSNSPSISNLPKKSGKKHNDKENYFIIDHKITGRPIDLNESKEAHQCKLNTKPIKHVVYERNRKNGKISFELLGAMEKKVIIQSDEIDKRSIFVKNIGKNVKREEIEMHFEECGKIVRVTIMFNIYTKKPKGCCYVEFEEIESAHESLSLNKSILNGRSIKVEPKRTNYPFIGRKPVIYPIFIPGDDIPKDIEKGHIVLPVYRNKRGEFNPF